MSTTTPSPPSFTPTPRFRGGKTEQELKAAGGQYKCIGKSNFSANSRAKTNMDTEGFVKIIAERLKETDKILGVHIIDTLGSLTTNSTFYKAESHLYKSYEQL